MRRLYLLIAFFAATCVLWTFILLRHEHIDEGRPFGSRRIGGGAEVLLPNADRVSLPLSQDGFSFRRYTRAAFATFVAHAALDDDGLFTFFYGRRPTLDFSSAAMMRQTLRHGLWFRLPGCADEDLDPAPPSLAEKTALFAAAAKASKTAKPINKLCIFSQMRPSKNLAVVALARKLNVTHIIESGRKGGASALMYDVLGFKVVSIELYPIPFVSSALSQLAPDMVLRDGDGSELIPDAISQIRSALPQARLAVILDGPKYDAAHKVFDAVRKNVVFAVFDDTYPGSEFRKKLELHELAVFFSDDPIWLSTGIPAHDSAKLQEGWPGDDKEPAHQFAEDWQAMAVIPGGSWTQWA